ncbi:gp49 [Bacillus phage G]|uniref:Gp49 n=1 Tax=Bacillus phage G TaxID=2884420 RepID=G3MBB9_9CAUD|nr:gp49 [Bacillus phage G]AEO93320.1 gp49 [Bacillus phage G]
MARKIKIIRRADIEKEYERMLKLELDYELASLFSAMNEKNEVDIEKSKKRLTEIQMDLESLKV